MMNREGVFSKNLRQNEEDYKMRKQPLPREEYERRIKLLQLELKKDDIDCFIGYSSECESATSRYLTGFWPFFDFSAIVVPAEGDALLVTGGPESSDFAKSFSMVDRIEIDPVLVESSAPEWVIPVEGTSIDRLVIDAVGYTPKRIGIGNWNIFPHQLFEELMRLRPLPEIVRADKQLLDVQAIKSEVEIPYIREAYRVTEESMKAALQNVHPGMQEWELESIARGKMLLLGAEGMSYPAWVCSGPNTHLSLARSTNRKLGEDELVQCTFGAKYMGYCGNMCRPFVIGKAPDNVRKLMEVALEAVEYALERIRPGEIASDIFDGYYKILSKYGHEEFTLYGPAHGTGSSEVEGLWLSKNANFQIKPFMLFNIDIWLSDGENGLRYEDGVLVREGGLEELTSYRREVIEL